MVFSLNRIQYTLVAIFAFLASSSTLPPFIRIGAISSGEHNGPTDLAFKYAINSINKDKSLLPETKLVFDLQHVAKDDSFHACQKVCVQIKSGIQAVFGPFDAALGSHIHSICDALDIPHLEMRINTNIANTEFSINLHPSQSFLNEAFEDVIRYLNWTRAGIMFEKDYGVLQLRKFGQMDDMEIHIRKVTPATYVKVLTELKDEEIHNLIIDTNAANISILLRGILQLQMNEYKYHYLFTSFDIETFDLDDFKYNFVNITSFRLVDVGDVNVRHILKNMEAFNNEHNKETTYYRKLRTIQTEPALVYDSVYIFAIGLKTLEQSHALRISNVSCEDETSWDGGLSLINYINSVEWRGLTGPIQFKEGRRVQFKLDLVKLRQHSTVKVGERSPQTRLNIIEPSLFFDAGTMNVTLVVITILETPYVMMHYGKNFTGNERFFGFCVDILELIARDIGFEYILDLVPDRKYGAQDPFTGEWNGGVFVVLLVGIGVAACVAVFEFWYHYRSLKRRSVYCEEEHQHTTIADTATGAPGSLILGDTSDHDKLQEDHVVEQQLTQTEHSCKHVAAYCCTETPSQRSLCGEMFDEFRYAFRCMDSHRRPALKRRCPTCHSLKDFKEYVEIEARASTDARFSIVGSATREAEFPVMHSRRISEPLLLISPTSSINNPVTEKIRLNYLDVKL